MNPSRRSVLAAGGFAAIAPLMKSWGRTSLPVADEQLMLSDFQSGYMLPGIAWRGFSDRVMGGISNADLQSARVGGKSCLRLTGNVTRESNGGFIQMALYFGRSYNELNGSDYNGIELLVYGNNEDYNLHVRTSDCSWYDQSYRFTFFAKPEWQRLRVPWDAFEPNNMRAPLDSSKLQRIAILGWMREFQADVSLAEISLFA